MKLSIIIPVYNEERNLRRCLESIKVSPSHSRDYEVIIIDNDSTDNSVKVAKEFVKNNKNMILIQHERNLGISASRNHGLEKARGEYITFLDSDDEYTPFGLNAIFDSIKAAEEADIVQLNHYREYPGGKRLAKFVNRSGTYRPDNLPSLWMVVWNKVFRASAIEGIRFPLNVIHGEDELFVLECLKRIESIRCSELVSVIHHKDNPHSCTHNVSKEDLITEQMALIFFLCNCEDPSLCKAVRERLSELWINPTYTKTFGGGK